MLKLAFGLYVLNDDDNDSGHTCNNDDDHDVFVAYDDDDDDDDDDDVVDFGAVVVMDDNDDDNDVDNADRFPKIQFPFFELGLDGNKNSNEGIKEETLLLICKTTDFTEKADKLYNNNHNKK